MSSNRPNLKKTQGLARLCDSESRRWFKSARYLMPELYASGFRDPRFLVSAPNGDVFVVESRANHPNPPRIQRNLIVQLHLYRRVVRIHEDRISIKFRCAFPSAAQ